MNKKIILKRFAAWFIDTLIFGCLRIVTVYRFEAVLVGIIHILLAFLWDLCKDLIFRHASPGKRIMGLVVVDMEGRIPSIRGVMVRSVISNVVGVYIFQWYWITSRNYTDWENEYVRMKVIERKAWKRRIDKRDLLKK